MAGGGKRKGLSPGVFAVEVYLNEIPADGGAARGRRGPGGWAVTAMSTTRQSFVFALKGPQGAISWLNQLFKVQKKKKVSRN